MAHLASEQLVAFLSLLPARYVQEDPMHVALMHAEIAAETTSRDPADLIFDQNAEICFVTAIDATGRGKGRPHPVPVGRVDAG